MPGAVNLRRGCLDCKQQVFMSVTVLQYLHKEADMPNTNLKYFFKKFASSCFSRSTRFAFFLCVSLYCQVC
jgi:hypothetical protein